MNSHVIWGKSVLSSLKKIRVEQVSANKFLAIDRTVKTSGAGNVIALVAQ